MGGGGLACERYGAENSVSVHLLCSEYEDVEVVLHR